MLNRNIKQSIDALSVFTKLEDKLYIEECAICRIDSYYYENDSYETYLIIKNKLTKNNIIINLHSNHNLTVDSDDITKCYKQQLSDEEFENIKKRFIKIAQMYQDNFENWLKDTDINNGIDAE